LPEQSLIGAWNRFDTWLWRSEEAAAWPERGLRSLLQYCVAVGRDIAAGELSLRAASLVYTTMLSLVPLLALSFSVLKGLGFHRELEPLLLRFFAPLGEQSEQVTTRIISFVDNVQGSLLASISLGLLLFTTLSMAQKVERSVNFVWRVERPKSFIRRSSEYASLMLAGPLVGTAALGLIAMIANTGFVTRLRALQPFGGLFALAGTLVPYLLIMAAFSFLYAFLPNTRVRISSAMTGGVVAGGLWVLGGYVFASFINSATETELIYSGFAAIVAMMLWLYLSWHVLLTGAQIAYYHQHPNARKGTGHAGSRSPASTSQLALGLMWRIATLFGRARRDSSLPALARSLDVPPARLQPVLDALQRADLVVATEMQQWLPARDPAAIAVADILAAVRSPSLDWPGCDATALGNVLDTLNRSALDSVGDLSLADLIRPLDAASTSVPHEPASAARRY
jgi:membrane protein